MSGLFTCGLLSRFPEDISTSNFCVLCKLRDTLDVNMQTGLMQSVYRFDKPKFDKFMHTIKGWAIIVIEKDVCEEF